MQASESFLIRYCKKNIVAKEFFPFGFAKYSESKFKLKQMLAENFKALLRGTFFKLLRLRFHL